MSKRAEIAALKAYPKEDSKMWHSAFGIFEFDKNAEARKAYQEGYEQAEKDLALTWEDVMFISQTVTEIINSIPDKPCPYTPGLKEICEETLKRFNSQREKI